VPLGIKSILFLASVRALADVGLERERLTSVTGLEKAEVNTEC
jgi:hypothetical protein